RRRGRAGLVEALAAVGTCPVPGTRHGASGQLSWALVELVGLARQGREAGLQEVVDPGRRQRPRQQPAEARRENLRDRKPGSRPRTDTTAACEEFANRLADIAAFDRLLVSLVRVSADERLTQEARDLVA